MLVSMNLDGVEYYYIRNAQVDIIGLFDKDDNQLASYTYNSWGTLFSIRDQNGVDITNDKTSVGYKNPYRYRGYRYDGDTGLYYLQSRYYNPQWGRFINSDELNYLGASGTILGNNLLAYCENNPVNMVDHDGHFAINVFCAVIGGFAGTHFSDYIAKTLGYRSGWKYWAIQSGVVVGGAVIGWFAGTLIINAISGYLRVILLWYLKSQIS
jgi:RHS repeat-associated protein